MGFDDLVAITNDLRQNYPENTDWNNSPFAWIRCLPPGSKGAIGRDIASGLLFRNGFTVSYSKQQLLVNGQSIEVRIGLMWDEQMLVFQNIRNRKFDHMLFVGICPNQVFTWLIPKAQLWNGSNLRIDKAGIKPQHKGADAWVTVPIDNIPPWMHTYGGTIEDMVHVAQSSL